MPLLSPTLHRVSRRALRAVAGRILPDRLLVLQGDRRHKRVALTFDDGPDSTTPALLRLLDKQSVRATFFVVGRAVADHPELVKSYVTHGHEVAGHGYTHTRFTHLDFDALKQELARTTELLERAGVHTKLVRPPGGAVNSKALYSLWRTGYVPVLWSCDSRDARTEDPREVARAMAPARMTRGDIVLLHEGQPWTMDALPEAIQTLKRDGYEFVTVSEILVHG